MVLVYLPTKLGDFVRANVGKYSSTMEHMGTCIIYIYIYTCVLVFEGYIYIYLSGQIIIIHKPELRPFGDDFQY